MDTSPGLALLLARAMRTLTNTDPGMRHSRFPGEQRMPRRRLTSLALVLLAPEPMGWATQPAPLLLPARATRRWSSPRTQMMTLCCAGVIQRLRPGAT
jgi:hypothetical protein